VRIRIGARQIQGGMPEGSPRNWDVHARGFQTVPQTHNVSILLLVPTDKSTGHIPVHVGMRTEYRKPGTGELFTRAETAAEAELRGLLDAQGYACSTGPSLLALAADAQNGRYDLFCERLTAADSPVSRSDGQRMTVGEINNLWTQLIAARETSDTDATEFQVPGYAAKSSPELTSNQAFIIDNGESAIALINGAYGFEPLRTTAVWTFSVDGTQDTVTLGSTNVQVAGRSQLSITFPSLLKNKLVRDGAKIKSSTIEVLDQGVAVPPSGGGTISASATFAQVDSPSSVIMTANKSSIVLATPSGSTVKATTADITLAFLAQGPSFKKLAGQSEDAIRELLMDGKLFTVAVDGAALEFKSADKPGALRQVSGTTSYIVTGLGNSEMTLSNLAPAAKVKITLIPPKGSGQPTTIELPVN
jgi:hypothetical protein